MVFNDTAVLQGKKRKALEVMTDGQSDKHAQETLKLGQSMMDARKMADLSRRDLQWSERTGASLSRSSCCVLPPAVTLSSDEEQVLQRLGVKFSVWKSDREYFRELLHFKDIVWFTPGDESAIAAQDGLNATERQTECQTGYLLTSRLLGGWVAGIEWLEACKRSRQTLQPVLRLARALAIPREMVCHESEKFGSLVSDVVAAANMVASANCAWVIRECRKKLLLGSSI